MQMRTTQQLPCHLVLVLLIGLLVQASFALAQEVPAQEVTLSNGMRLLMVERHDEPAVSGGWVAHVGSVHEQPGMTGIAHLFEHMMFKGTPTIGTQDYERDQELIREQERVREKMREEMKKMRATVRRGEIPDATSPEHQTERYRELKKEFDQLVEEQRRILVKNEFDRIYTEHGASGMNAGTTRDLTLYFITVPANKLELWMWMESERLLRPVFREFYAEREVVFEERRMRTESTPLGKFKETFEAMFWTSHPYSWPVIGWPSDIPAITKEQADRFYDQFYDPANITLALVGDFDPEQAVAMAEKYFGRIASKRVETPDLVTAEIEAVAEKRMNAQAETNPQVEVRWHTVAFGHPDSYVLEVLAELLSTRTGRLYKGMVLGSEIATHVAAAQDSRKYAGFFSIKAEAKEGHTPEELERAVYNEVNRLRSERVTEKELQKVKNNFAAYEYRKLSSDFHILIQLLFYDGLGDWREINEAGPKYQAVTPEDLQRVVNKYFTPEKRAVALYTRKEGSGSSQEAPDLAGLNNQQKTAIRQVEAKLQEVEDSAQLQQALQQIESQMDQAGEEQKPFFQAYANRIRQRLNELQSNGSNSKSPAQTHTNTTSDSNP